MEEEESSVDEAEDFAMGVRLVVDLNTEVAIWEEAGEVRSRRSCYVMGILIF